MLGWYTRMIELRRQVVGSAGATTLVTFDEGDRWLTMTRGPLAVVVNLSERTQSVPHSAPDGCGILAASSPADLEGASVQLAPASVAVLGPG